jgi:two-component system, response regulator RegA
MTQSRARHVESVLVVDDDERVLKSWERALRADGKTVYVASDIKAALAVRPLPDVAVVDLYLAHAELGTDVIRELKCLDPNIYTVLVSAAMSVPQAVAGMREGADDCEVKPVAPRHLLRRIEHGEASAIVGEMLTLDDVEWEHISRALSDCGGNISHAAKALGLHRQSLQRKLRLRSARGSDY